MFEENMIRYIYLVLSLLSVFAPGPLPSIISFVVAIAVLVYKINVVKETSRDYTTIMFDIVCIVIIVLLNIGIIIYTVAIEVEYGGTSSTSIDASEAVSIEDFAEMIILDYKLGNLSQFSSDKNNSATKKNGFITFLKEEVEADNLTINGNKITYPVGEKKIIFTVTKNDIKYTIK